MDTASSPQIRMAEVAAAKLLKTLESAKFRGNWDRKGAISAAKEIVRRLPEIKYSYMEPGELRESEAMRALKEGCMKILHALGGREWHKEFLAQASKEERRGVEEAVARVRWALNIIYNLDARLTLGDDPAYAVDIRVGEVMSVHRHPDAERLLICNVNVGRAITVVTNDLTVREGDRVAVALLPPAEFRGVVSEGMFVGAGEGVVRNVDGDIGTAPHLEVDALQEVRNQVMRVLRE